jgi:hypothetical protein
MNTRLAKELLYKYYYEQAVGSTENALGPIFFQAYGVIGL